MTSVRGPGPGPHIRIDTDITTQPSGPLGPVAQPGAKKAQQQQPQPDMGQKQEEMFDAAHQMSLRGEQAAQQLAGNKKAKKKKDVKKNAGSHGILGDNKRVDGVFPDGDPHNKQEQAFQQAAEFEEKVKDSDLTFRRKANQVDGGSSGDVSERELDGGAGVVMGGEAAEITGNFSIEDDDPDNEPTAIRNKPTAPTGEETQTRVQFSPTPTPAVEPAAQPEPVEVGPSLRNVPDDTIPGIEVPTSETGLRKMLGLKTKAK